jgi:hypothetical protein
MQVLRLPGVGCLGGCRGLRGIRGLRMGITWRPRISKSLKGECDVKRD